MQGLMNGERIPLTKRPGSGIAFMGTLASAPILLVFRGLSLESQLPRRQGLGQVAPQELRTVTGTHRGTQQMDLEMLERKQTLLMLSNPSLL